MRGTVHGAQWGEAGGGGDGGPLGGLEVSLALSVFLAGHAFQPSSPIPYSKSQPGSRSRRELGSRAPRIIRE